MFLKQNLLTVVLCIVSSVVFAQTNDEIRKRADDFFEAEKYVEATKDYLHLLSLSPTDPDLNFKYGTCLLFNSNNKNKALRYLTYAIKNEGIDPRAFFFNGKALHLDYQFEKAKVSYIQYQEKRTKKDDRYKVELAIKMCESGKKLLATFTDIIVTNKQEISSDNFYKIYSDSKTIGGEILVVAKFQSKMDKKMNHIPVVHFPPNAKAIYYSSYGEDGANGLDIYIRRRLPDGTWGDPQPLPGAVNTSENEDFPYLHPSGNFLYFSSTGHNSMGGYDVFMSRFDTESNSFFTPENVDFAICSPDDDLFYVVDSLFQNAYFASSRQSEDGKYHVYNVKVARVPIQEVIVMGNFLSEINPNNETMRITVTSNSNGAEVGKIVSNEQGKYSFVFPKGGKYNYDITVGSNEGNVYKYVVELPFLDEFRPLKQKAIHKMVDGQEIVTIINLFDENVEGAEAEIAEVIRKKAALEVNVDKFDLKKLEQQEARNKILAELGFKNMSTKEVSEQLNDLANGEEKRSEMVERIESNIDVAVIQQSEELTKLNAELTEILKKAAQETDPVAKHSLLLKAKKLESDIQSINANIALLTVMKNEVIQKVGAPTSNGVGKIEVIENQFNSLIAADKEDDAIALLMKNKEVIQKAKNESVENYVSNLVQRSLKLNEEIKVLKKQQVDYELSQNGLEAQINQLKNQLISAKKKEVDQIKQEIAEKENELALVKEALSKTNKRISEKNSELDALNRSIETLQKAMSNSDLAAYNKSQVDEAIKKSKTIENQVLANGTDQKIVELERQNPSLNTSNNVNVESKETVALKIESYEAKMNEIQNQNFNSELEKYKQEQSIVENTIEDLNRKLQLIENELKNDGTNEDLLNQKEQASEFIQELESRKAEIETKANALNTTEVNSLSANELKAQFESELAQIDSNTRNSDEEKLRLKSESILKRLDEVDEALSKIEKNLGVNPSNKTLQAEKGDLLAFKTALEQQKEEIDLKLTNLNSASNDLVAIQNNLNDQKAKIQANNSLNSNDKLEAEIKLNAESVDAISTRIDEIDNALKTNSKDKSLLNEKEALNEYKIEIEEENQRLEKQINSNVSNSNQSNVIAEIQSGLKARVAQIQEDSTLPVDQKIKLEQQANNESIEAINSRLNEIENRLSNDPTNAQLLSEKGQLEDYKSTLQSNNLKLNSELIALNNGNTPNISEMENVQTLLKDKTESIRSNQALSEQEKIESEIQIYTDAISKINEQLSRISSEPSNNAEEIKKLENYKSSLELHVDELNNALSNLNASNKNEENSVEIIQTNLQAKFDAINANTSIPELEKLKMQQEANRESIDQIDKRINAIEAQLADDADNTELLEEQLALIQYKMSIEQQNAELENQIASLTPTNTTDLTQEQLIQSIQSNYSDRLNEIETNEGLTELEKLEQKQALDMELVNAAKKENATNNKLLAKNPDQQELEAKKELLNALLAQKESEIAERMQLINAKKNVSSVVDIEKLETEMIAEVNPNYNQTKASIESSEISEFEKGKALLELEYVHLEKLKNKQSELEKSLKRNSTDEDLKTKLEIVNKLIDSQQVEIESMKLNTLNAITAQEVEEGLKEIDESYYRDIAILQNDAENRNNTQIVEREEQLQDNLMSAISENEKELSKTYSVTVELEKAIYEKALEESKRRVQQSERVNSSDKTVIATLRSNETEDIEQALNSNSRTKSEIETLDSKLANYEQKLVDRISAIEVELSNNSTKEKQEELSILEAELEKVRAKRKQFSVTLGELNTSLETSNTTQLEAIKNNLEQDRQLHTETSNELAKAISENPNDKTLELTTKFNSEKQAEIDALIKLAETETSTEEQINRLKIAQEEQQKLNATIKEIIAERNIKAIENKSGTSLMSQEEVEELKRKFSVQIGELTTEIEKTNDQLQTAAEGDKELLSQRKENLTNEKSLLELRVEELLRNRAKETSSIDPLISDEFKNVNVSSEKEKEIRSNPAYETYYSEAQRALKLEEELKKQQEDLAKGKSELVKMIENGASLSSNEVVSKQAELKTKESKYNETNSLHKQAIVEANKNLPGNNEEAKLMKSLVAKGSVPDKSSVLSDNGSNVQNSNGNEKSDFQIYAKGNEVEKSNIPVISENRSGLIFRVQVGAYAKPIPASLFNEFDPVSGELIQGSNITRYMAGYFVKSEDAYAAQSKIRSFGYRDAFVVAYCNGERISIGEAKKRLAEGTCVANGKTIFNTEDNVELNSEVKLNENKQIENSNTKTVNQTSLSSNAESSATLKNSNSVAKSTAVNVTTMEGLFFTVQIGVYNGFVDDSHLHGMQEVNSLELPDGQVRYSSGIFSSVDEAKPRRILALNNGVRGAFITAYYEGKRITLYEAKKLLSTHGNAILQSEIDKRKAEKKTVIDNAETIEMPIVEEKKPKAAQFVSFSQYDLFPDEQLDRYNLEGFYYYDSTDQHIKSALFKTEEDLPKQLKNQNEFKIQTFDSDVIEEEVVVIQVNQTILPGDFMDWLMKQSFKRQFTLYDDRIEIVLSGIEPNVMMKVQKDIRTFALEMEVRNVPDVEFE